jgi:TrmH family RNA methyltransferase
MNQKAVVWGADLEGQNIHLIEKKEEAAYESLLLVMGNEANGIRQNTRAFIDKYVTIPRYGEAESLNVAMATAILIDNLKRVGY